MYGFCFIIPMTHNMESFEFSIIAFHFFFPCLNLVRKWNNINQVLSNVTQNLSKRYFYFQSTNFVNNSLNGILLHTEAKSFRLNSSLFVNHTCCSAVKCKTEERKRERESTERYSLASSFIYGHVLSCERARTSRLPPFHCFERRNYW